jgi:hypothetical protein
MGKSFLSTEGKALGSSFFKMKDGTNRFRLVGEVLPRYEYWVEANKKREAFECLQFDPNSERFVNSNPDPVRELFPDAKCAWCYHIQVFDYADNKIKVFALKKKLFEQIRKVAKKLGDPTDLDTGWDCVVLREKTGPLPINIEYTLDALECQKAPVSREVRAIIDAELKPISEVLPREDVQTQRARVKAFYDANVLSEIAGTNTSASTEEKDLPF